MLYTLLTRTLDHLRVCVCVHDLVVDMHGTLQPRIRHTISACPVTHVQVLKGFIKTDCSRPHNDGYGQNNVLCMTVSMIKHKSNLRSHCRVIHYNMLIKHSYSNTVIKNRHHTVYTHSSVIRHREMVQGIERSI